MLQEVEAETAGPSVDYESAELKERLRRYICELDEPFRSLIVLRDIQQASYRDVRAITGLSESQVKVYLHRARKRLREEFEACKTKN